MLKDHDTVHVAAIPMVGIESMEEDDRDIAGVYSVEVEQGISEQEKAGAALDGFHGSVAVDCLDDFEFYVFDPDTGKVLVEANDGEGYALEHLSGDVYRMEDDLPGIFSVVCGGETAMVAADDAVSAMDKGVSVLGTDGPCSVSQVLNR